MNFTMRVFYDLALVALAPAILRSQAVVPRVDSTQPTTSEPPEVLSPFVVQSARDTGYQATSTLAGTRLNTPVYYLSASI